jgi:hypothetical protein
MRYSDCDITEFKIREALAEAHEAHDTALVDEAMRDILAGHFDSDAVHEVMQRRAGSFHDYQRVREARDVAVMAARHCGGKR